MNIRLQVRLLLLCLASFTPCSAQNKTDRGDVTFTREQLGESAHALVLQVSRVEVSPEPANLKNKAEFVGSAGWIDTDGFVIIPYRLLLPHIGSLQQHSSQLLVTEILPPSTGTLFQGEGVLQSAADFASWDEHRVLAVLHVSNHPWARTMHGIMVAENVDNRKVEKSVEQYWVPRFATEPPRVGAEVMVASVQPNEQLPRVVVEFASVSSVVPSETLSCPEFFLPLNSATEAGAMVLDAQKRLLGIVIEQNGARFARTISAKCIEAALNSAKSKFSNLKAARNQ